MTHSARIAIIGGGFSGAAVALNLLRSEGNIQLAIIEPATRVGPGLAFGTCEPFHLLNVPAGRMSILPADPDHFLRWLEGLKPDSHEASLRPRDLTAQSFVPRLLFGCYVEATLAQAVARSTAKFLHLRSTAEGIERSHGSYRITLGDRTDALADYVVLALGNFAPTLVHPACREILAHPRYTHDIWRDQPWHKARSSERILFLGTGLTMVDGVLAFRRCGHRGKLLGVSRRGLRPATHRLGTSIPPIIDLSSSPHSVAELLDTIRNAVSSKARAGVPWQAVIDSLRAITPQLWRKLPLTEQRRFLRHLKSYWETNRHRLAPELADELRSLESSGDLEVLAGNLVAVKPAGEGFEVSLRRRGSLVIESTKVDRIVNCTGPEARLDETTSPLFTALFGHGLISPDPLSMGLRATPEGCLVDAHGDANGSLLTLGPLLRGSAWETTAVPEIRVQAQTVAETIGRSLEHTLYDTDHRST